MLKRKPENKREKITQSIKKEAKKTNSTIRMIQKEKKVNENGKAINIRDILFLPTKMHIYQYVYK